MSQNEQNELSANDSSSSTVQYATISSSQAPSSSHRYSIEDRNIYQCIFDLAIVEKRSSALLALSKERESCPDLALVLWYSCGTMTALLQEIVKLYPVLSPPSLTAQASNRVCNALALLQCVASHPETRQHFLNAHIPLFLYPYLNTYTRAKPFEYLRLTSLGVVGALVKVDDPEVISFLLQTEIIPLCLRVMENGSELSKTVATFILQKVLLDERGLEYVCATFERFITVNRVLEKMLETTLIPSESSSSSTTTTTTTTVASTTTTTTTQSATRLLKQILRCYIRLSDHPQARKTLSDCLLACISKKSVPNFIKDEQTQMLLKQLQTILLNKNNNIIITSENIEDSTN